MKILQIELNSNVTSVSSDNTRCGHLVLTMTPLDYLLKTPDPFNPPNNPGTGPTIEQRATAPTITKAHRAIQVDKKVYDIYHAMDKALKLQFLAAVEEVYFRDLHDNDVSYTSVSTQLLLDHL